MAAASIVRPGAAGQGCTDTREWVNATAGLSVYVFLGTMLSAGWSSAALSVHRRAGLSRVT